MDTTIRQVGHHPMEPGLTDHKHHNTHLKKTPILLKSFMVCLGHKNNSMNAVDWIICSKTVIHFDGFIHGHSYFSFCLNNCNKCLDSNNAWLNNRQNRIFTIYFDTQILNPFISTVWRTRKKNLGTPMATVLFPLEETASIIMEQRFKQLSQEGILRKMVKEKFLLYFRWRINYFIIWTPRLNIDYKYFYWTIM